MLQRIWQIVLTEKAKSDIASTSPYTIHTLWQVSSVLWFKNDLNPKRSISLIRGHWTPHGRTSLFLMGLNNSIHCCIRSFMDWCWWGKQEVVGSLKTLSTFLGKRENISPIKLHTDAHTHTFDSDCFISVSSRATVLLWELFETLWHMDPSKKLVRNTSYAVGKKKKKKKQNTYNAPKNCSPLIYKFKFTVYYLTQLCSLLPERRRKQHSSTHKTPVSLRDHVFSAQRSCSMGHDWRKSLFHSNFFIKITAGDETTTASTAHMGVYLSSPQSVIEILLEVRPDREP